MKLIGLGLSMSGVAVSYAGFIYGWGLTPLSWPWIIGASVVSLILVGCGQIVSGHD